MPPILRLFRRRILFTAINLVGLAIGVAGFLFVALYVRGEVSYDRHFTDGERLYRIANTITLPGRPPLFGTGAAPAMASLLRQEFPEVEAVTRVERQAGIALRREQGTAFIEPMLWADPTFFDLLDFPFQAGDPATALARPDGLVLTEPLARKLFGTADPMGREVRAGDGTVLTVTGVLAPLPPTHLDFAAIAADGARGADSFDRRPAESWSQGEAITYARLAAGQDPVAVAARLPDFLNRFATGLPPADMFPDFLALRLDPVRDIHLRIKAVNDPKPGGNVTLLTSLMAVAALILGIAIVNYANLATAQAIQRAKEVGVRKVAGAKRRQLVAQFLSESVAMAAAGTLLALGMVELLTPAFNAMVDRDLSLWRMMTIDLAAVLLLTPLAVGVLGGLYPAFVLSGYRPAVVLKGAADGGSGAGRIRAVLVVLQFAISITLVIATVTVHRQVEHARTAELGYSPESLVYAGILEGEPERFQTLRRELEAHPGIAAVTFSSIVPADRSESISTVSVIGRENVGPPPTVSSHQVAPDFFDVYGIPLIAGPGLPAGWQPGAVPLDPNGNPYQVAGEFAVVTRAAVTRLGFSSPEEAVGAQIDAAPDGQKFPTTIVGVVDDVRIRSARDAAEPIFFTFVSQADYVTVKLHPGDPRPVLDHLDRTVERLFPDLQDRRRHFVDDRLEAQYQGERRQAQVFATFAILAIILANLGLFGLSALAAARRTKEIGVRRVVGATVAQVVFLLARQFTRPVLLANLVAWPVAWIVMSRWLEQFTVRIDLGPGVFLLAGGGALLIALATVALHAARIAVIPPARSLRHE